MELYEVTRQDGSVRIYRLKATIQAILALEPKAVVKVLRPDGQMEWK